VEHYQGKIKEVTTQLDEEKEKGLYTSTALAYVICRSEKSAVAVMESMETLVFSFGKIPAARLAPAVSNILW